MPCLKVPSIIGLVKNACGFGGIAAILSVDSVSLTESDGELVGAGLLQRPSHPFGQALAVSGGVDGLGFVGIGQETALDEHGGSILAAQHIHEPGASDAPIGTPGVREQVSMDASGQHQIGRIVLIVREGGGGVVGVDPGRGRGEAAGRQGVGFQASRLGVGECRIEMEADEQAGLTGLGQSHPFGQGQIHVVGAGEEHRPPACLEQGLEAEGPVEGQFLLEAVAREASTARLDASVSRIEHDGLGLRPGRSECQRLEGLDPVQRVDANRSAEVHGFEADVMGDSRDFHRPRPGLDLGSRQPLRPAPRGDGSPRFVVVGRRLDRSDRGHGCRRRGSRRRCRGHRGLDRARALTLALAQSGRLRGRDERRRKAGVRRRFRG